ncbi:hypothetical protein LGT39_02875 [Demequina sp. TTPB684]|uniref:hypothetical protein n=1 Tax=unclassified Demequina TaxID=2620311 RepID=UPI001CF16E20|nr:MULTISPECIES: hypothetical protein [unclassified Demequina]MCB2411792.1 hypothetical protein [Demequina sp. TTPB684]UPU89021.1 hypothetical protein LGT36_003605 [Demequina sp. TMPB413]
MTAILWPDVEAALITHLKPRIALLPLVFAPDVDVSNALADPRPDYAVTVRNDGGPPTATVFADVRAGLNVWALEKQNAVDLAAYLTALINSMPGLGDSPFVNAIAGVASEIAEASDHTHLYLTASLRVRGIDL